MATFTFFSALEKLSNTENDKNINESKRLVIPDYFLKLLLQNKTRLLKEQFNKKSIKDILTNKYFINKNYYEPLFPNVGFANQKYKSLEKNNNNVENNKYNSSLPKIADKKTILNLRYKEDPRNYEKYKNLGKEIMNIQSKYNRNMQTESLILNQNENQNYITAKNKNSNSKDNTNFSNNSIEYNLKKLNCQNMTFVGPFSSSMLSRNSGKINNVEEIVKECKINNNSFKNKINKNSDINNISNNIIHDYEENNSNNSNSNNTIYNNNKGDIFEYNHYPYNNEIYKQNKYKEKKTNKKLISVIDNSSYNNVETPQKKIFIKKNLKDYQINIRPFKFLNSYSSHNKSIKILPQSKLNSISLLLNFKHKYTSREEIQKKISKKIIKFPLNINISQNNMKDTYYYFINKMYRNQLIEYMKHRINWELITSNNDGQKVINFYWKYMSNRVNFKNFKYESNKPCKKLRMINLFERNYEVGNKKNMFINLINYCDKININTFNLVPFTIIINNTKDVDYCLESINDIIHFVNKSKTINLNNDSDLITDRKYNDHFWFDKNFDNLNKQYIYINKNFLSNKNYWILKPTDLYQGKCIEICNSFEEINKKCRNMFKGVEKKFIPELIIKEEESDDENIQNINNSKANLNVNEENDINIINETNSNINNNNINTNGKKNNINNNTFINYNSNKKKISFSKMYCSNEIIIQKYLDRPLLYNKRKFDIRCFVLVDSNLNVFFCKEGHLKGSSELYDLNNTNKLIHITNYSLQKKSVNFEQYEDGNEISYNDFKKYMKDNNIPLEYFNYMIEQMKYLVEISFKSVGYKLLKTNPVLCFEIFGYDFIIDNDFKPWILEINNNPGLCISSPLIKKLVPRMLDDAFRLTIDKVFETVYSPEVIDIDGKYKSKFQLDGFTDEENIFEFLCNVN